MRRGGKYLNCCYGVVTIQELIISMDDSPFPPPSPPPIQHNLTPDNLFGLTRRIYWSLVRDHEYINPSNLGTTTNVLTFRWHERELNRGTHASLFRLFEIWMMAGVWPGRPITKFWVNFRLLYVTKSIRSSSEFWPRYLRACALGGCNCL